MTQDSGMSDDQVVATADNTLRGPEAFLDVRDLRVHFQTEDGLVRAVDGVSFQVERGQTLGIVGESGSGKSVTSLSLMGLHKRANKRGRGGAIMGGEIWLDGEELVSASEERLEKLRGEKMAMIFQDPLSAMHPYYTVGEQIAEAYLAHHKVSKAMPAHARSRCSIGSVFRSRTPAPTTTRTSSPAACGSAR
jgi:peptide/nickel transport system ATP-binding protein